jgi:hypothetical protein
MEMFMLKITLILLVGVLALTLILAATKPDTFRVQRSIVIKATPERIFPLINDFHNWGAWSPWEKMDTQLKRTFSGTAIGQGAVYTWEGNNKVGTGRMEIIETFAPVKIRIKLDFLKPFEGHNIAEFTMVPQGGSTEVIWSMHGPTPYLAKIMHLFFSMDRVVGEQFDTGLANLKAIAER